jgi:hypothetical protein
MWNGDIGIAIIVDTIVAEINKYCENLDIKFFSESIVHLKNKFSTMTDAELVNLLKLCVGLYNYKQNEKVELVITAPNSFKLNARKTTIAVKELIATAKTSITITGYSISDYFKEIIDEILNKSKKGVYVNFYINDLESKKEQLDKIFLYRGRYLKIFEYNNKSDDKMAALHAKVIVVDGYKSFISSANLSYHGMVGNIEVGVLIESEKKARNLEELLRELRYQKVFKLIN